MLKNSLGLVWSNVQGFAHVVATQVGFRRTRLSEASADGADASYVSIRGTGLPNRIRELREHRHLTQAELASAAGLTYRTVHDIEAGRRSRVLEKTLMLVASGLDLRLDDLLVRDSSEPAARRWRPGKPVLIAAIGAMLLVTLGLAHQESIRRASWVVTEAGVEGRDGYFGFTIWRSHFDCRQIRVEVAPWSPDELLVGVRQCNGINENLYCIDRRTGAPIWEVGPDIDALTAAFGWEDVFAGKMQYRKSRAADLDGDGHPELIAEFNHSLYYPYAICRIDQRGHLLNQYANKGFVFDSAVLDVDGDDKEEFIGAGVNNSKAYQGPTLFILDNEHFAGASIDSNTDSWSSQPDSALVRVVIPCFPQRYQDRMDDMRLGAFELEVYTGPDGLPRIRVAVGGSNRPSHRVFVTLDHELNPLQTGIKDDFAEHISQSWPDSLKENTGPIDPEWRDAWMRTAVRFEAGHWPPKQPEASAPSQ